MVRIGFEWRPADYYSRVNEYCNYDPVDGNKKPSLEEEIVAYGLLLSEDPKESLVGRDFFLRQALWIPHYLLHKRFFGSWAFDEDRYMEAVQQASLYLCSVLEVRTVVNSGGVEYRSCTFNPVRGRWRNYAMQSLSHVIKGSLFGRPVEKRRRERFRFLSWDTGLSNGDGDVGSFESLISGSPGFDGEVAESFWQRVEAGVGRDDVHLLEKIYFQDSGKPNLSDVARELEISRQAVAERHTKLLRRLKATFSSGKCDAEGLEMVA